MPRWLPPFVSSLAAEDRCHLNGLAMEDGRPRYVTAMSETDTPQGWRPGKATGGCLIDVPSGATVARGLAMPHSPRVHQGRIWLLDSGRGRLVTVDPKTGSAEVVCELPGYARGLALVGPLALVGLSKIRETSTFGGVPVADRRDKLKCGVAIVELGSGRQVSAARIPFGRRGNLRRPVTERGAKSRHIRALPRSRGEPSHLVGAPAPMSTRDSSSLFIGRRLRERSDLVCTIRLPRRHLLNPDGRQRALLMRKSYPARLLYAAAQHAAIGSGGLETGTQLVLDSSCVPVSTPLHLDGIHAETIQDVLIHDGKPLDGVVRADRRRRQSEAFTLFGINDGGNARGPMVGEVDWN